MPESAYELSSPWIVQFTATKSQQADFGSVATLSLDRKIAEAYVTAMLALTQSEC